MHWAGWQSQNAFCSSYTRPVLNMRPKERLWQLPADTHIIDWLDAKGFVYDVITEDDLEAEGVALLAVAPRALDLAGRASACTTVRDGPPLAYPTVIVYVNSHFGCYVSNNTIG